MFTVQKLVSEHSSGLLLLRQFAFMGLKDDGSMTHISKCVEGDDRFHVQGALIVAPDKALKFTMEQLRRMIDACGDHPVFIVSPCLGMSDAPVAVKHTTGQTSRRRTF